MAEGGTLQEYKSLLVNFFRGLEAERARGDSRKLKELDRISDDDLLRKWLWIVSIVGGLATFLVLPFVFNFLGLFTPYLIMELLWTVLKLAMGMVVIACCLAIYFTVRKSS